MVEQVWRWLEDVPDPEIPAISVVDLGIVRDVVWSDDTVRVAITPTYSGCPAMRAIERDIERALRAHGVRRVEIETRLAPAWTTDWLSAAGRAKLRDYGIAPPGACACPRCSSANVGEISRFGSTPCKALYRCNACREPFDYFKSH